MPSQSVKKKSRKKTFGSLVSGMTCPLPTPIAGHNPDWLGLGGRDPADEILAKSISLDPLSIWKMVERIKSWLMQGPQLLTQL